MEASDKSRGVKRVSTPKWNFAFNIYYKILNLIKDLYTLIVKRRIVFRLSAYLNKARYPEREEKGILIMEQKDLVLACMAAANGASYQPVQIQKLIFLFQERTNKGGIFNFIPYDYGPYDPEIYHRLEELSDEGSVEIVGGPYAKRRLYKLTPDGVQRAKAELNKLSQSDQDYLTRLSEWVRSVSFAQLIGAIYTAYPEMRENSVFRG